MSRTSDFLVALLRAFQPAKAREASRARAPAAPTGAQRFVDDAEKGRYGQSATVEIDARAVGTVTLGYAPERDGDPDPGEVVWTWVPYEERDGRGKDRPVIIVASGRDGSFLAVQLTSKNHGGHSDYISLGSGPWDSSGRASWASIDRTFQVFPSGIRREAATLDRERYDLVADALRKRYGWK